MLLKLASPDARPARRLAVQKLSDALYEGGRGLGRRLLRRPGPATQADVSSGLCGDVSCEVSPAAAAAPWPSSDVAARRTARTSRRASAASWLLLRSHVDRQVAAGWRGAAAVGSLSYLAVRVGLGALVRTAVRGAAAALRAVLPRPVAAAAAAAGGAAAAWLGHELAALGQSATRVSEELALVARAARAARGDATEAAGG